MKEYDEEIWYDYDGYEHFGSKKIEMCIYENCLDLFGLGWVMFLNKRTGLLDIDFSDIYDYDETNDVFKVNLSKYGYQELDIPACYINIVNNPHNGSVRDSK